MITIRNSARSYIRTKMVLTKKTKKILKKELNDGSDSYNLKLKDFWTGLKAIKDPTDSKLGVIQMTGKTAGSSIHRIFNIYIMMPKTARRAIFPDLVEIDIQKSASTILLAYVENIDKYPKHKELMGSLKDGLYEQYKVLFNVISSGGIKITDVNDSEIMDLITTLSKKQLKYFKVFYKESVDIRKEALSKMPKRNKRNIGRYKEKRRPFRIYEYHEAQVRRLLNGIVGCHTTQISIHDGIAIDKSLLVRSLVPSSVVFPNGAIIRFKIK